MDDKKCSVIHLSILLTRPAIIITIGLICFLTCRRLLKPENTMKGMNQLINDYSTVQEATAQVHDANVATDEVQRYYLLPIKCS